MGCRPSRLGNKRGYATHGAAGGSQSSSTPGHVQRVREAGTLGHQPGRGKCDSPAPAAHPRLLLHGVSSVLTQGPGGPTRVLRVSVPLLCLESRDRFWAPSWALLLTPYY